MHRSALTPPSFPVLDENQAHAAMPCRESTFTLRTLEEAQELINRLACFCPNPAKAMIGLGELLINAIEHGNLEISGKEKIRLKEEERWLEEIEARLKSPRFNQRQVTVKLQQEQQQLVFTISDQGIGFDWKKVTPELPDDDHDYGGRGIFLARHLCFSSVDYQGCGNRVVAVIRLDDLNAHDAAAHP